LIIARREKEGRFSHQTCGRKKEGVYVLITHEGGRGFQSKLIGSFGGEGIIKTQVEKPNGYKKKGCVL